MKTENKPEKGVFYILQPDMRSGGRGHGVQFVNENSVPFPAYLSSPPESGGIAMLHEVPRLRHDHRNGDMPRDLDSGFKDYWLVSEPLKHVFQTVDPEGFSFAPCEFLLEDGSQAPPHYLCEVVRILDAIDETASRVKVLTGYPNGKYYSIAGGADLAFEKEVIGSAHVFRTPYTADAFCDHILRDALRASGFGKSPRTRGVRLIDAAGC
ncbi:DUF1629 domain-containing protein [Xanthomonas axonopodis pv. begoniae]|uniref:imm11 family protein n=1 Tax=Xanthomonas phaseoli TaxID=1985254 RepID=UPI000CEE10DA|nr:DUF1629 domain-containing protein [Xanthomonas phaseoli]MBO9738884.1 DUF1629 domain-containing protein [Xanthomonas axonopodis pv. begoniae]MBO9772925.1 DUF1629 domain-containing protein [Xanthomonas axonopodis pv. begoniae]MCC8470233.1 DUF1629 domain-containing protein [Xanthomonas phaseoli]PPT31998.1 hypothetical protein XabCFBP2524_20555 [Xanthomonas axonopodis pv. begoniae]